MKAARLPRGCVEMLGRPSGAVAVCDDHDVALAVAERHGCAVAVAPAGELAAMAKRMRNAWPCLDVLVVHCPGQPREVALKAAEAVGGLVLDVGTT